MSSEVSYLRKLGRIHSEPLLGEISLAVAIDCQRISVGTPSEKLEAIWAEYDKAFGTRLDYRLWRLLFRTSRSGRTATVDADACELALAAIESPVPVVVWGTFAIIPGWLIRMFRDGGLLPQCYVDLVTNCSAKLYSGLQPIKNAAAECALSRVFLLDAIQKLQRSLGVFHTGEPAAVLHWLREVKQNLSAASPGWEPGSFFDLSALSSKRHEHRRLFPFDQDDLSLRTAHVLYHIRGFLLAAAAGREIDTQVKELLHNSVLYGASGWRTIRVLRLSVEALSSRTGPPVSGRPWSRSKLNINGLISDEMNALKMTAGAAWAAGDIGTSAALSHLLLRVLPDALIEESRFRDLGTELAFVVRNAGLEVDERFNKRRHAPSLKPSTPPAKVRPQPEADPGERKVGMAVTNGTTDELGVPRTGIEKPRDNTPYHRRISEWLRGEGESLMTGHGYTLTMDGAKHLIKDCLNRTQSKPEVMQFAFQTALSMGRIQDASKLLQLVKPSADNVISLAHAIKRALQILPFGADIRSHQRWQDALRSAWGRLEELKPLRPSEVLLLHEILLGRISSNLRHCSERARRQLASKYYGLLDEREIRIALTDQRISNFRGIGTVSEPRLKRFLQKTSGAPLGSPVCVSVSRFGKDRWSILTVGKNGSAAFRESPPIADALVHAASLQRARYWRIVEGFAVPWGRQLTTLGSVIVEAALEADQSARWLLLAIEPELSALPWQELILRLHPGRPVVSLTPSLTWASLAYEREHDYKQRTQTRLGGDADLQHLAKRIATDSQLLVRRYGSAVVVLGHGAWLADDLPTIATSGRAIELETWFDLLGSSRISVIHSCFGGKAPQRFLGDLGGLPGLALSLGARLVCAPIAEVSLQAAEVLHRHLIQPNGPVDVGSRYLRAIAECEGVRLYTLYGFPDEGRSSQ